MLHSAALCDAAASAMQLGSVLLTTDPHFEKVVQIVVEVLEPHLDRPRK
jgi:hypothetical protein